MRTNGFGIARIMKYVVLALVIAFVAMLMIYANFISVKMPVASIPCGMKLSQIRIILSGCFLFLDSPDT